MNKEKERLNMWEERLARSLAAYDQKLQKMAEREKQYAGNRDIRPVTENDKKKDGKNRHAAHIWNITAENIEAEIDSSIPMPKATPLRRADEELARMIENMLRTELDRLPTEEINDEAERVTKKQGGCGLLTEWDSSCRTHTTTGANSLKTVHPTRIIPQSGVTSLDDADYYIILTPMTKGAVRRRWGVDVEDQAEDHPELRDGTDSEEMVTVKMAYYRNEDRSVGSFIWVGETVCADIEDVQARRLRRCRKCGQTEADNAIMLEMPTQNGEYPDGAKTRKPRRDECSYCGSRSWESTTETSHLVPLDDLARLGVRPEVCAVLEMMQIKKGENAERTVEIPYYKPDMYPLVLMKNVTAHAEFLGESDCDKLADQQNTTNRVWTKILERQFKAGTKITAPPDARVVIDSEENEIIRIQNLTDIELMKQFDFSGDLAYEFRSLEKAGAEARDALGITESFLGKRDATADSAKAKQFAASQTAGRLESKRVMKKLAWSQVFERMFKYMLAYADEKRPIYYINKEGERDYEEFNAYQFLDVDEAGELYWNDQFIFSCDDASGLAANREAMWQEATRQFQAGAYGAPNAIDTLIIYWGKLEEQHYPGAGATKKLLEDQREQQRAAQQAQQAQQMMPQAQQMMPQTAPAVPMNG